jgi:hypothetical protein
LNFICQNGFNVIYNNAALPTIAVHIILSGFLFTYQSVDYEWRNLITFLSIFFATDLSMQEFFKITRIFAVIYNTEAGATIFK